MTESARKQRNADMVLELWSGFRLKIENIIVGMEGRGFRPRIQEAWRSPAMELKDFELGFSHIKYGFHNVTGATGEPESLAVDILDDDFPLHPRTIFLLNLAELAEEQGLHTGIRWGLSPQLANGITVAIAQKNYSAPVKIGWDPCHIEPINITPDQARSGVRPSF